MPTVKETRLTPNPLDQITLTVEFSLRELAHLTILLGCTHEEITSGIGLIHDEQDARRIYTALRDAVREVSEDHAPSLDIDRFHGPRVVWEQVEDLEPF